MQSTNINTCMPSEHQERLIERLSTACHVLPHNGFVSFVSLLIFFFSFQKAQTPSAHVTSKAIAIGEHKTLVVTGAFVCVHLSVAV